MNTRLKIVVDSDPIYLPAYHRGEWVGVPLFFLPAGAFDRETGELHRVKVTILSDDPLDQPVRRSGEQCWSTHASSLPNTLVPWLVSPKELKELCKRFDIPLGWVTGMTRKSRFKEESLRRKSRNNKSLTSDQWRKFIRHLRKIDPACALIAEIVWFINNQLVAGGGFVTLEMVLRLRLDDIILAHEGQPILIRLKRVGFGGLSLMVHYLPDDLSERLYQLASPHQYFVFCNNEGTPLSLQQINKQFKQAGKLAKLGFDVTPLCLRPPFDKQALESSIRNAFLDEVSLDEWALICERIPTLIERRGCKSTHDPLNMLNAILFHIREKCSFRNLPNIFPPWKAVAAQHRRWVGKKMIEKVISVRKKMRKIQQSVL